MEELTSERRRLVWLALSDFYLDTELQAHELAYIRSVFEQSGFSQAQIKRINYEEVVPVLFGNLWIMADVQDIVDKEQIVDRIITRLKEPRANQSWGPVWWLWCRQVDYYTKRYFDVVFASA